jgi:hypothetical protein
MKNRAYFLREDLDTYKPKFKILCAEKRIETDNLIKKFVYVNNNHYIRQRKIKIETL